MYAARSQGLDGLSGTRVYLKLLAPESAELEREQKGDAGTYRKSVQVAYLLVWVPAADWIQADSAARKRLTTLPLRHLRSLYPQASLFVSVFDGETPLAHANWKSTQKVPRVELL